MASYPRLTGASLGGALDGLDLGLRRRSLGRFQQRRLIIVEAEIGSLRLHLVRQRRDGLRAAHLFPGEPQLAGHEAVATLRPSKAALSGAVAPTGGQYGLQDVVNHIENAATYFGTTPPASVDPAAVLAPLQ